MSAYYMSNCLPQLAFPYQLKGQDDLGRPWPQTDRDSS